MGWWPISIFYSHCQHELEPTVSAQPKPGWQLCHQKCTNVPNECRHGTASFKRVSADTFSNPEVTVDSLFLRYSRILIRFYVLEDSYKHKGWFILKKSHKATCWPLCHSTIRLDSLLSDGLLSDVLKYKEPIEDTLDPFKGFGCLCLAMVWQLSSDKMNYYLCGDQCNCGVKVPCFLNCWLFVLKTIWDNYHSHQTQVNKLSWFEALPVTILLVRLTGQFSVAMNVRFSMIYLKTKH